MRPQTLLRPWKLPILQTSSYITVSDVNIFTEFLKCSITFPISILITQLYIQFKIIIVSVKYFLKLGCWYKIHNLKCYGSTKKTILLRSQAFDDKNADIIITLLTPTIDIVTDTFRLLKLVVPLILLSTDSPFGFFFGNISYNNEQLLKAVPYVYSKFNKLYNLLISYVVIDR